MSNTQVTTAQASPPPIRRSINWGSILVEGKAFGALLVIIVVFSLLSPNYLTVGNLLTMSSHVAIYGILSIGMLLVIITGGIDLSVGSILGLAGVVAGYLMQGVTFTPLGVVYYLPLWAVVVVTLAVGTLLGAVTGVLVAYMRVPAFVATLGILYVARGIALLITNGLTYNDLAGNAVYGNTGFGWLGFNRLFGIPVSVIIMVLLAIIFGVVLMRTAYGRWIYATGGNQRAAELSGVPVRFVHVSVYALSGMMAAAAGLVLSSQLTSAGPTAGTTYEMVAIASVVVGGASLMGGRGNVQGTMLGAFVIGFLSDGLVIIGVSAYWQIVFTGAVIVLAVLLNNLHYGRGGRRR